MPKRRKVEAEPAPTPAQASSPAGADPAAPVSQKPAPKKRAPRAAKAKAGASAQAPKPGQPVRPASRPAAPSQPAEEPETEPQDAPLEPEVVQDGEEVLAALPVESLHDTGEAPLPVPVGRDLSHADALQRYMADVTRYPLLTREEEHALAVKFRDTQDPRLAYRLVTANLRLVVKIANEYRRAAFNLLDLVQEGNVGLMQAVQKYDPMRGVKLSSYAAWWIRAYILRYLMDNWRMVKLGTTQAQRKLFFNLRKEQEKLLSQGFEAAPKLLAERLDVSEQDIREMDQRLGNEELSLDAPVSGEDDSRQNYLDRLAEGGQGTEEQLGEEQLRRVLREKLEAFKATLTSDKDLFLFEHRLNLAEGAEPMTLQEVGDKYGFTRERARQLEARLTDRLREYLRKELPDFETLDLRAPEEE